MSARNRPLSELRRDGALVVQVECSAGHLLAGVITDVRGPLVVRHRAFGIDLPPAASGNLPVTCSCERPDGSKIDLRIDLAALRRRFDKHDWTRPTTDRAKYADVAAPGYPES